MSEQEKNNEQENNPQEGERKSEVFNYQSNIWKSYLYHFFIGLFFIAGILIPFFLIWGNLTFFEVMLLETYFTIAMFAFEIPCGAISDYISRKFSLFLAGISLAFASIVYSSVPNIMCFMLGETLFAFGSALITGTTDAIIYDTLRKLEKEDEITKITARNQSSNLAGMMISAPIGSLMALYMPLNYVFAYMFFPFIVSALIALSLKEPNHDLEKTKAKYLEVIRSGFKELKNNKVLRILAFDLVVINVFAFYIFWMYQIYLGDMGVPIVLFGFIAAAMTLTQIIFTNLIVKANEKIKNKKRLLFIYSLIPGLGFIFLAIIHFTFVSILLILVVVGTSFTRNNLFTQGINENIETENRATVISTMGMIGGLMKVVMNPIIGLLVMWNLNFVFILLGSSIIILSLLSPVKNEYLK